METKSQSGSIVEFNGKRVDIWDGVMSKLDHLESDSDMAEYIEFHAQLIQECSKRIENVGMWHVRSLVNIASNTLKEIELEECENDDKV